MWILMMFVGCVIVMVNIFVVFFVKIWINIGVLWGFLFFVEREREKKIFFFIFLYFDIKYF